MGQNYENTELLEFQPFYTSEIQKSTKKLLIKKEVTIKPKISNKELSQLLPYHPKRSKRLTKHQIFDRVLHFSNDYVDRSLLEYLPFHTDKVEISKRKPKKKRNTIPSRRHRRIKKRKNFTR